jgi:hypothetical protein
MLMQPLDRLQQDYRRPGFRFGYRFLMLGLPAFEEGRNRALAASAAQGCADSINSGFLPSSTSLVAA